MRSKKLAGNKINASTQKYLDIAEIKDDCVVLKDGTMRAVVLVSSINFALKSEDEQNAIISAYVSFLNFLEYPLQIVIQSRKLDIDGYINRLRKIEKEQVNELLRLQIVEYTNYVKELVEIGDIMTKRFYVVVPYNPLSDKQKSWFKRFMGLFSAASEVKLSQQNFVKRRHDLFQRVEHVLTGLGSMGVKSIVLDTASLIELYYNTYNLDVYSKEKLTDLNKLQVEE
ncbi:MAG: hypothetical protein WCX71_03495 [Candidatus Buchananbacteria bacterium]